MKILRQISYFPAITFRMDSSQLQNSDVSSDFELLITKLRPRVGALLRDCREQAFIHRGIWKRLSLDQPSLSENQRVI